MQQYLDSALAASDHGHTALPGGAFDSLLQSRQIMIQMSYSSIDELGEGRRDVRCSSRRQYQAASEIDLAIG
ncbi:hypothetical protein D3C78_1826080 [compost metagenome]